MSLSSNYGDARMRRLGARLHKIYAQASRELTEKADSFFKQFEEKDAEMRALYEAGEITKHRWISWRENQMMTGKRWNDLRDTMAQRMTSANQIAARYMNHELPAVYAHNWNDLMHDVESKVKGFSFDIVNERTIRKLSTSDKTLLPYKVVDGRRDVRWNSKRVNSQVLQGILQGEDAAQLAKRLQSVTRMNEESALRNARTAVTSAQNKGRMDAMLKAEDDGVIMGKEWIATKDERTREAHLELDRTVVKADEPFENEIGRIMYPGDPDADPANTYNCRCTIAEVVLGFKPKEEKEESVEEPVQETKIEPVQESQADIEYMEKLNSEKDEVIAMDDMDQGAWLYEHDVAPMDELLEAAENGNISEYTNRYFNALEQNGSPVSEKELIDQPDMSAKLAANGNDWTQARKDTIQELTGFKGAELDEVSDNLDTWVSNRWDKADASIIDKYIDADGTYDGELWRGMHFNTEQELRAFTDQAFVGGTLNVGEAGRNASWASSKPNAETFMNAGDHKVLIHCIGNKSASPIDYINYMGESEVVSHSQARYTVLGVQTEGNSETSRTIITVIEKAIRGD